MNHPPLPRNEGGAPAPLVAPEPTPATATQFARNEGGAPAPLVGLGDFGGCGG